MTARKTTPPAAPLTDVEAAQAADIHTSSYIAGQVSAKVTFPQTMGYDADSHASRLHARLEVTDRASGQTIVSIVMNADQFLSFMSSSSANVDDARLAPNPQHLGRRSQHTGVNISRTGMGDDLDARAETVAAWYRDHSWIPSISRTNYGLRVHATRWLDDEDNPVT